jgi:predicted permease
VGTGLFVRTFLNLIFLDTGFERENVLLAGVDIRSTALPAERRQALYDDLVARLRSIPGVRSASQSMITPISGSSWNDNIHPEGYSAKSARDLLVWFNRVSPGYFESLGIPLIAGRDFDRRDALTSPKVAIVNETLARRFFPHTTAIGKTYRTEKPSGQLDQPVEIVGVVKDALYARLREGNVATAFAPSSQDAKTPPSTTLLLRSAIPAASLVPSVKQSLAAMDSRISVTFKTLDTQVRESILQERLLATLSSFFGGLALLLASVGLYGVISYMVGRRRNEIGIRMALGSGAVLWLVLREVALLLAAGIVMGSGAALATTSLVRKMLFGVMPNDAGTIAMAAAVLLAIAGAAGFVPARRASSLHPMEALREE